MPDSPVGWTKQRACRSAFSRLHRWRSSPSSPFPFIPWSRSLCAALAANTLVFLSESALSAPSFRLAAPRMREWERERGSEWDRERGAGGEVSFRVDWDRMRYNWSSSPYSFILREYKIVLSCRKDRPSARPEFTTLAREKQGAKWIFYRIRRIVLNVVMSSCNFLYIKFLYPTLQSVWDAIPRLIEKNHQYINAQSYF